MGRVRPLDGPGGVLTPVHLQKKNHTTIATLQVHFHKPLAQVAKELNVCMTLIKRVCRRHGITRWPYRKVTFHPRGTPPAHRLFTTDQGPP